MVVTNLRKTVWAPPYRENLWSSKAYLLYLSQDAGQETLWGNLWPDCHSLYLRYQSDVYASWVMSMNPGNHARPFQDYIKQSYIAFSLSIRLLITVRADWVPDSYQGNLMRLLSAGSRHWAYKKGIKGHTARNLLLEWTGSRRYWTPRPGGWCQGI